MPAGKLLACEPYGPLGTIGPRGLLCFGGRQAASEKYHKQPTSPFTIKMIGDELMYYISDQEMLESGETPLQLFKSLCLIANEPDEILFRSVKIGVAFWESAYAITFWKGMPDIYGKDIDLAVRLVGLAEPREIVMNEEFNQRIRESYQSTGNKEDFEEVDKIRGPWPVMLKGFSKYINVYKLPAPPVAVYDRPLRGW